MTRGDVKYFVGIWNATDTFLGSSAILFKQPREEERKELTSITIFFNLPAGWCWTEWHHRATNQPCMATAFWDALVFASWQSVSVWQCNDALKHYKYRSQHLENLLGDNIFLLIVRAWLILEMSHTLSYSEAQNYFAQPLSETWMSKLLMAKQKLIKWWC